MPPARGPYGMRRGCGPTGSWCRPRNARGKLENAWSASFFHHTGRADYGRRFMRAARVPITERDQGRQTGRPSARALVWPHIRVCNDTARLPAREPAGRGAGARRRTCRLQASSCRFCPDNDWRKLDGRSGRLAGSSTRAAQGRRIERRIGPAGFAATRQTWHDRKQGGSEFCWGRGRAGNVTSRFWSRSIHRTGTGERGGGGPPPRSATAVMHGHSGVGRHGFRPVKP